jgi:hypothetical protein
MISFLGIVTCRPIAREWLGKQVFCNISAEQQKDIHC